MTSCPSLYLYPPVWPKAHPCVTCEPWVSQVLGLMPPKILHSAGLRDQLVVYQLVLGCCLDSWPRIPPQDPLSAFLSFGLCYPLTWVTCASIKSCLLPVFHLRYSAPFRTCPRSWDPGFVISFSSPGVNHSVILNFGGGL